jgi:predicted RNA-binding protein with PUA-like domain
MNWLVKEEPGNYSFETLVRDGRTSWTGVKNPLAQRHLKQIRKGERLLYYHTGNVKAIVGIAVALTDAYPDPKDPSARLAAVDVGPVAALPQPITLAAVKASGAFGEFPLVRMPRLSVMPVTDLEWQALLALGARP